MARAYIYIDPVRVRKVLANSTEYRVYSHRVATRIKDAAMTVFSRAQRWDNEWRLSETTPPKYLASFRIEWHKATITHRMINGDPGWNLVEYGAHPGGHPHVFVLRYRPLARGLDIVAAGGG